MPDQYVGGQYGGTGNGLAAHGQQPLTPDHAPAKDIVELWTRTAKRFERSRARILMCRELRRNTDAVKVDRAWASQFPAAAEWLGHAMPERLTIGLNLVNSLGEHEPTYTRHPMGTSDMAVRLADQCEVWANAVRKQLVNWDQLLAKAADDGEFASVVLPAPADWSGAPTFFETLDLKAGVQLRKPRDRYDRDEAGKDPEDRGYRDRDPKKSRQAWRDEYIDYLATRLPFAARIVSALDCVPILARGRGRKTFECRGLVCRTLFEKEELLRLGYQWQRMGDDSLIPRGHESGNNAGQNGMLYLYEAYLCHYDQESGEETPFAAYCVGGESTTMRGAGGEQEAAVVNLREEYGLNRLMVNYFWGLHTSDDDPDWMGVPLLYPIAPSIVNFEALTSAHLAHTWENAFGGHMLELDANMPPSSFMEGNNLRQFRKPLTGEVLSFPGKAVPFNQATVTGDARYMLESLRRSILENDPSEGVEGGASPSASGHSKLVSYDLLKSAKRQVREGARECVEWIGECVLELATGLAESRWKATGGKGIRVPVYEDVEHTLDDGKIQVQREAIEFNPRWTGSNFSLTANYPKVGNLAEVEQRMSLYERGGGTFEEVREAVGDPSPETTRIKIARDRWMQSPEAQQLIALEVARLRGDVEKAQQLELMMSGQMTPDGLPTAALAPELQSATGPGPGGTGSPTQGQNMGQNVLNGTISGQVGQASQAAAAQAIMAGGGPRP